MRKSGGRWPTPPSSADNSEFRELSVEYARLTPVAERFGALPGARARARVRARHAERRRSRACARWAARKSARLAPEIERAEDALKTLLIPRDPRDDKNIYLEVRAGTGGDEAAIFAGDLFRMYARYAETHGFTVEIAVGESRRARRLSRDHQPHRRARRVRALQVRIRRASRAARARHRSAGPHPHLRRAPSRSCRSPTKSKPRISIPPNCASTPIAPRAPAASTSTRPIRPFASRTCPPASWSSARTSARSTRTARARWR